MSSFGNYTIPFSYYFTGTAATPNNSVILSLEDYSKLIKMQEDLVSTLQRMESKLNSIDDRLEKMHKINAKFGVASV